MNIIYTLIALIFYFSMGLDPVTFWAYIGILSVWGVIIVISFVVDVYTLGKWLDKMKDNKDKRNLK